MENDITYIKVVLAFLLRKEDWSEAEMMYLNTAVLALGIRIDNKRDDNNLLREVAN